MIRNRDSVRLGHFNGVYTVIAAGLHFVQMFDLVELVVTVAVGNAVQTGGNLPLVVVHAGYGGNLNAQTTPLDAAMSAGTGSTSDSAIALLTAGGVIHRDRRTDR